MKKEYFLSSSKINSIKHALIQSVKGIETDSGQILVGANLTLVQGAHWGMASTLTEADVHRNFIEEIADLDTLSVHMLIQKLLSERLFEASLGMAALNSVLPLPPAMQSADAYAEIESRSAGKKVAVVGHFPFVNRLQKIAEQCWVFERRLQDGDLPSEEMPNYLPDVEVLVLTAQIITNNCFHHIISLAPHAYKIMLGPSTPMSPVLFDYGLDVIGGIRVQNARQVYDYIARGAHFKQLKGIEKITLKR